MASGRIQRLTLLNQDFSAHRHWSERLENTPSNIEVLDDGVLVDAGGSLLHLDPEGIPGKAFHTFLDIFDLVTAPGEQIWINPDLTPIPSERALLLRLNRLGQRTGKAGRRSQDDKWKGLLDRVFLAAGPGRIAAVHAIMPQLRIFDSSTGRELARTRIDHPSFAFMAQAYDWPYYDRSKRSLRAPRYTAGAAALDDRLYVLLHLPDPEIIEFSWEGEELRRWRLRDLGFQAFDYGGFDVRRSEGKLKWVTSVVHRYQEDGRRHYQPRVLEVSFRASEAGEP
ncbi:MAG TPA: hypothetical protein VLV83_06135 [Acidobacteriota bacterium]|nr:hypothetical protein [Acidobacteriota bacterium]